MVQQQQQTTNFVWQVNGPFVSVVVVYGPPVRENRQTNFGRVRDYTISYRRNGFNFVCIFFKLLIIIKDDASISSCQS